MNTYSAILAIIADKLYTIVNEIISTQITLKATNNNILSKKFSTETDTE